MKNSAANGGQMQNRIRKRTKTGGKDYGFDEDHDPNKPAQYWFSESEEGVTLFIVFYSQACQWSQCLGCNLPSKMSARHIGFDSIMAQIDYLFSLSEIQKRFGAIKKVIVSNNGSIMDEETFSSTALIYLIAKLNLHFSTLSVLSIETRPEYIDIEELEFLARALDEGACHTSLELAVGFEAFDEKIRNDIFNKGLSLSVFEKTAKILAEYGFSLKCYFMLKPVPEISGEEAITDIHGAIDYLSQISEKFGGKINMHLNPTYAATGTVLAKCFLSGEYTPPTLKELARAALHGRGKNISIFLGLSDEGLACEGGSFVRPGDGETVKILETFNKTQDFDLLDQVANHQR